MTIITRGTKRPLLRSGFSARTSGVRHKEGSSSAENRPPNTICHLYLRHGSALAYPTHQGSSTLSI